VHATGEIAGTERTAGREPIGDAENGLRVVAFVAEDQQIGAGRTETVTGEKLILSQLVIFGRCLPDVMGLNGVPECHPSMVLRTVPLRGALAVTSLCG
jgi:hypothetical protein